MILADFVHPEIVERFALLEKEGHLAHAYLFVGPKDVGKIATAMAVARALNCEDNSDGQRALPCEQCSSCRRISSGNYPDVLLLDKGENQSIRISDIRELVNRIQLRAFEARKKVFIIRDVEDLSLEGANALLKTLEEPGPDSLLILTTSVIEKNLPTIRSRCHTVRLFSTGEDDLSKRLTVEYKISDDAAHFLAHFSEGCAGRAVRLNEDGAFERKNAVIDEFVYRRDEAYFKQLLADKVETQEALRILLSWYRDVLLLKVSDGQERLINIDRRGDLETLREKYSFVQVEDIIHEIVGTLKMLDENLSIKIPVQLLRTKIWVRS